MTIIQKMRRLVYHIRLQDYKGAKDWIAEVVRYYSASDNIKPIINAYGEFSVKNRMAELMGALENGDMIYLADQIEGIVIPAIVDLCEEYQAEYDTDGFHIEKATTGDWTVKNIKENIYLHSCFDPMEEARLQAEHIYNPRYNEYAVWGCGLLYHVYQLWIKSDESIHIYVYEESKELIELAQKYGPFEKIPAEIDVILDNGELFSSKIANNEIGIWMHLTSIKTMKNNQMMNAMMRFYMAWNGAILLKQSLDINFRMNTQLCSHNIVERKNDFLGRAVAIIAGGPSVDHSMELIRECLSKNMTVLAVNTVIRKLLNERIIPDYLVVMDCHRRTYKHIEGIKYDNKIALMADSTAYWKFAKMHVGDCYLVLQQGYEQAEKLAKERNLPTFDTGSSVTVMAMDVALRMGAETIYLIGADMAYYNRSSHATGTVFQTEESEEHMIPVEAVDGSTVYTTIALDEYRREIENKIIEYPSVKVINCSKTGAKIHGAVSLGFYKPAL